MGSYFYCRYRRRPQAKTLEAAPLIYTALNPLAARLANRLFRPRFPLICRGCSLASEKPTPSTYYVGRRAPCGAASDAANECEEVWCWRSMRADGAQIVDVSVIACYRSQQHLSHRCAQSPHAAPLLALSLINRTSLDSE